MWHPILRNLISTNLRCRWLIAHDYEDEAFTILADIENRSEDDPFILTQHKEIVAAVQFERANTVSWGKLLIGKTGDKGGTKTLRRLLLGMGTQMMQQLSGNFLQTWIFTNFADYLSQVSM